jgi:parallel beta-helix repeat protein
MPSGRIPDYPLAVLPLSGAELLEIVQAGPPRRGPGSEFFAMGPFVSVAWFGADGAGLENDTAAFTSALALGRPVWVPAGTYLVDNVVIPSGAKIFGDGATTIIMPFTDVVGPPDMIFRCNNNVDIDIGYMKFSVSKTTSPTKHIIHCDGGSNINVHDCIFDESGQVAIHLVNLVEGAIERNHITNAASNGILCSGSRLRIVNNHVNIPNSLLYGIAILDGVRCVIAHNTVNDTGHFGIFVGDSLECVVDNNTIFNSDREAVNLANSDWCHVTNNVCGWDGAAGSDFGMSLYSAQSSCSHNTVANNTVVNAQHAGIANAGPVPDGFPCSNNLYCGNVVYNCNIFGNWWGAGILVYGPASEDNKVDGNFLVDDGGGSMFYGVHDWAGGGGKPTGTFITNNRVIGAATADIARNTASASSLVALNGQIAQEYTPEITTDNAAPLVATVNAAHYQETEKMVDLFFDIEIDDNAGGTGDLQIELPFQASASIPAMGVARNVITAGVMLQVIVTAGALTAKILSYDNVYPVATGDRVIGSVRYQRL